MDNALIEFPYLNYVFSSWSNYSPYVFSKCHYDKFVQSKEYRLFVFSTNIYGNFVLGNVKHTKFFKVLEVLNKGFTTPIGLIFEIKNEKGNIVRYTKHALTVTTKELRSEDVNSLASKTQYSTHYLDILSIGNEAEIATDLRIIMGVTL